MEEVEVFAREATAVALKAIDQGLARVKRSRQDLMDRATGIIRRAQRAVGVAMAKGFIRPPLDSGWPISRAASALAAMTGEARGADRKSGTIIAAVGLFRPVVAGRAAPMDDDPDPGPMPADPAKSPPPSGKDFLGEKTVLKNLVKRVEDLLGALGTVAGARHGLHVAEPKALEAFLQMNPEEGFDLEALNILDMRAVGREAREEKELLRAVMEKVDQLSPRLRAETEDASLVGSILRNMTLEWYRESPTDPDWVADRVPRWGGIFAESRVPGGRLSPKLSTRLDGLRTECEKANRWAVAIQHIQSGAGAILGRIPGVRSLLKSSKRPRRPLMPQVAQAYLDDLAAGSRSADRPFPMERLTRLARRIGAAEMNITLGTLFPQEGGEPFLVLDPRLHPDIEGIRVRPTTDKAAGDAPTYDLTSAASPAPAEPSAGAEPTIDPSIVSPWDREDLAKEDWSGVLETLDKGKATLDPPPVGEYRERSSYLRLREHLLDDPSARTAFLSVHWKGKPSGLILLDKLLCDGTYVPEVETDGDYLESELSHIEKGDPDHRPADGRWTLGYGWTVSREIAADNSVTYRADHGAIASPPPAPNLVAPDQDPS